MPSSERERDGAAGDDEHVAAADREQVVEARRAEALPQRVRETAVLAEHDAFEDRAPLSRQTGRRGAREPARAAGRRRRRAAGRTRHADARSTTCTPWRRSHVRS